MKNISILFLLLLLMQCATDSLTGTVDDTDTGIAIAGKVIGQNGEGIPNVIAKLNNTGFSDTTARLSEYRELGAHLCRELPVRCVGRWGTHGAGPQQSQCLA